MCWRQKCIARLRSSTHKKASDIIQLLLYVPLLATACLHGGLISPNPLSNKCMNKVTSRQRRSKLSLIIYNFEKLPSLNQSERQRRFCGSRKHLKSSVKFRILRGFSEENRKTLPRMNSWKNQGFFSRFSTLQLLFSPGFCQRSLIPLPMSPPPLPRPALQMSHPGFLAMSAML